MYIHEQLTALGFNIDEIIAFGDTEKGYISYVLKMDGLKLVFMRYFSGKVSLNYYKGTQGRELEFSFNYINNEEFIIFYIKDFLKSDLTFLKDM